MSYGRKKIKPEKINQHFLTSNQNKGLDKSLRQHFLELNVIERNTNQYNIKREILDQKIKVEKQMVEYRLRPLALGLALAM